jgi:hypothetical protein
MSRPGVTGIRNEKARVINLVRIEARIWARNIDASIFSELAVK